MRPCPIHSGALVFCTGLALASPLAAQDIGPRVSGDARMGLTWERPPPWAQRESGLRMTARTRLKFQFTGQTDGGTRFGAEFELDPDRARPTPRRVFIGE